jgi:hypothetical protein
MGNFDGLIGLRVTPPLCSVEMYGQDTPSIIRYAWLHDGTVVVGVQDPDGQIWEGRATGLRVLVEKTPTEGTENDVDPSPDPTP